MVPVYNWQTANADQRFTQDIAYIYQILHCNHFIILSNATAYETSTIDGCVSTVVVLMIIKKPSQGSDTHWF